MKKRLLTEEAEQVLGGCDEADHSSVNFAEITDYAQSLDYRDICTVYIRVSGCKNIIQ